MCLARGLLNFFLWLCFFFNDTATTEIYTLSLHDALPILIVGLRHITEAIYRVQGQINGIELDMTEGMNQRRMTFPSRELTAL